MLNGIALWAAGLVVGALVKSVLPKWWNKLMVKFRKDAKAKADKDAEDAEKARVKAIKDAEIEKQKAIEDERLRVTQLEKDAEAERVKRESDKAHIKKIDSEAIDCLVDLKIERDLAQKIILAIAENKIKNVTINY